MTSLWLPSPWQDMVHDVNINPNNMTGKESTYLKPIGTLQLIAIVAVVIGHFAVKDPSFMNSHWVSFCFVYSGFFTAMRHRFGSDYGIKTHAHFMLDKLAKLYPLHLFALALGLFDAWYVWGSNTINLKVLFTQLTLISPWIPDPNYYFAINPVGWFLCDLFFLYLMAPVIVKLLRRCRLTWQIVGIIILLGIEMAGGYTSKPNTGSSLLGMYLLYEFPPIRLLDFATGIILCNITQGAWWQQLQSQVTSRKATLIETTGTLLSVVLYLIEKSVLFPHCYRAFCVMAPGIVILMATFLLTSKTNGLISKALGFGPLTRFNTIGYEIYLLQFGVYYLLKPTLQSMGLHQYDPLQFALFFAALLVVSWLTHRCYVAPVGKWLHSQHQRILIEENSNTPPKTTK